MPHILSYVLIGLFGLLAMALDPAQAAGSEPTADSDPAYTEAKAKIAAADYAGALPLLDQLTTDQPDNADAWNLRGFANRKLGNMDVAAVSYSTALKLNPGHLGALEYQGEMYLQLGQSDAAKANLQTLQGLCGNCEEANDLAEAIAEES
ncbi:MAG: tetratricopeptide repeat protein [Cypionkella sp.]|uniref:tetratricopeptide repeat protein n=1 Tax=Cypionkella sp. TaxID=2811411 RepID=UPI002ABB29DE|nr:tetratricopeptide repeat protein [Cypionkella sp.]MDZ4309075.1 tetratricopeptide repeat protein [Cypionkella sp.]